MLKVGYQEEMKKAGLEVTEQMTIKAMQEALLGTIKDGQVWENSTGEKFIIDGVKDIKHIGVKNGAGVGSDISIDWLFDKYTRTATVVDEYGNRDDMLKALEEGKTFTLAYTEPVIGEFRCAYCGGRGKAAYIVTDGSHLYKMGPACMKHLGVELPKCKKGGGAA